MVIYLDSTKRNKPGVFVLAFFIGMLLFSLYGILMSVENITVAFHNVDLDYNVCLIYNDLNSQNLQRDNESIYFNYRKIQDTNLFNETSTMEDNYRYSLASMKKNISLLFIFTFVFASCFTFIVISLSRFVIRGEF